VTRVRGTAATLIMIILCTGCTGTGIATTRTLPASAVASGAPQLPRAQCGGPRPAGVDPFPFNRAASERDRVVGISDAGDYEAGGVAHFDGLDATGLAVLLEERFVDPDDRQNASPTVWEIFRFLCSHPTVRAAGYVVSPDREDYRTSIEAIKAPAIDAHLRADARAFCTDTDGLELGDSLECFWD